MFHHRLRTASPRHLLRAVANGLVHWKISDQSRFHQPPMDGGPAVLSCELWWSLVYRIQAAAHSTPIEGNKRSEIRQREYNIHNSITVSDELMLCVSVFKMRATFYFETRRATRWIISRYIAIKSVITSSLRPKISDTPASILVQNDAVRGHILRKSQFFFLH